MKNKNGIKRVLERGVGFVLAWNGTEKSVVIKNEFGTWGGDEGWVITKGAESEYAAFFSFFFLI